MNALCGLALIGVLASIAAGGPEDPRDQAARPIDWRGTGVWRLVPDLASVDLEGKVRRLSDYKDQKALVIALTSTTCPLTQKQSPTLARLEDQLRSLGAAFLFVNSEAADTDEDMREQVRKLGFDGPYLPDRERLFARSLAARTTTEVFVLDQARTLMYRGAIDDQYGFSYSLQAPRNSYLIDAVQAVVAGRRPEVQATWSPGCMLELEPMHSKPTLTYHGRVSRIIAANCLDCHHDGGPAPFSLASYEQVVKRAPMMQYVLDKGMMPPWHATPPAPGEPSRWSNDRSLNPQDKLDLLSWLASDRPRGDESEAALPRSFAGEWTIGQPDAVLQIPEPIAIKADGVVPYKYAQVETTFSHERWVRAIEVRPTARQVVHHVLVFVIPKGDPAQRPGQRLRERLDETRGFFAAYVPGNGAVSYPVGFAKRLPAGATLLFQIHYTPNGVPAEDQTRIGLVFSDEAPAHVIRTHGIANRRISIPPGAPRHQEQASLTVPQDVRVLSFMPHMHVRGIAARYEAFPPKGMRQTLLDVPFYDFNWQTRYTLRDPVLLGAGTKLTFTGWFDNSGDNKANPDPGKRVRWGQQTTDEMLLGYVEYYLVNEDHSEQPDGLAPAEPAAEVPEAPASPESERKER